MRSRRSSAILAIMGALAALLIMPSPAHAGNKDGRFAVEEVGRSSCAAFVRAREEKSVAYGRYVGFMEGYMTAANRYEPNTFDLTPWHNAAAISLIVDQHCRRNAQDSLVMVAQRMVVALQPFRLADFSNLLAVGEGDHEVIVYETILKRAQFELSRKGLYAGERDGRFTPQLKTALLEFQKRAKLDPTGLPDPATLWVLLSP